MRNNRSILLIVSLLLFGGAFSTLKRGYSTENAPDKITRSFSSREEPKIQSKAESSAVKEAMSALTVEEQKKFNLVKELLWLKNDNDPRYDTELSSLSSPVKRALIGLYENTGRDRLNERGTIAFLIGRELKNENEVGFLQKILMEPPYLSPGQGSSHDEGVAETLANYPQLISLRALVAALRNQSELGYAIEAALREAKNSPNARIRNEIAKLGEEFNLY